ncbi:General transcription factor 3C polypeptide 3 AltName: Full=Transcription factor IIIC 102 kDa subunit [Rhizoctonia solani AG-1 IB]|uniref:Rhizoctonia solani AG1-IB WGS project CAOJ00000000 data, isolate 7/3/14, contig 20421 n=1 Tax=Thanatephorus cucumeris (strain AG1-IB / isolate 7/3/14) TaxID=1108050 RepID=M5C7G0_THACB|nr:General transcription factor 3C polypeptide 3 AltName: Full=Transcription factor IIIC 102 kDa subunit [Rhizoctonia solani AG-1 IB]
MDNHEDTDHWEDEEVSGSDYHDSSEGSDEFDEHDEQFTAKEAHLELSHLGRTSRVDEADGSAESQIMGDFDQKMKEIQLSNSDNQSLGKDWDFTIADYDPDNFDLQDELRQATGIGKRKGKGRARGPRQVQLSQEVHHFLGQAHSAYASGDRETAIKLLQDVIKIEPGVANAWGTLAFCYEDVGDTSRALKLRIMAAHLEGDADQWVELGLKSREIGSMEQAVYCYRNAARLDKTNADVLWDYAFCLRESGQTQKARLAIKTYESILQILPHDLTILAQLRGLLIQTGDLSRAMEHYSAAFEHYISSTPQPTASGAPTDMAIDPLLTSVPDSRMIDTTNEFGTREVATLADLLSGLGEHARAVDVVNHAYIILAHDINEYYELHTELADVFYEINSYEDAVTIYERLACQPHTSSLHVLNQIGSCHRQMKNYTAARDVYQRIIDVDPDEHDAKMKLAEVYDILNEKRLALELVNQVIKAREQIQSRTSTSGAHTPAEASLFVERAPTASTLTTKKPTNKPTLTPAEAQRMERERVDTVVRGFKRLKDLDPGEICSNTGGGTDERWDEWLSVAEELVRIFMGEKKLFISDRYKEFSGLKRQSKRSKTEDMAVAVQERDVKDITEYARRLITRHQFSNDALRLLLASLGGGITAAEAFVDSALQKYFFREMVQFERAAKGEPAVFVGGGRNRWDFGGGKSGNDEDDGEGVGPSTKGSGPSASANASNPHPVLPTKESPAYATAYGQISGGTRSYQSAIYYLLKAYDTAPNDPVICLSLGAACIGRAMQRQADNRNHMVTQVGIRIFIQIQGHTGI